MKMAKKQGVKFSEIIKAYAIGQQMKLQTTLPVYEAIFEMAINIIPNPKEAQTYRTEKIWDGQINSNIGKALIQCRDDGPTIMYVTNVRFDPNSKNCELVEFFWQSKVTTASRDALSETEISEVSLDMGLLREEVTEVSAGSLASFTLSGKVKAGETLVDLEHKDTMVPFEGICYISEPVVILAIEPKRVQDIPFLLDALEKLANEDPNLKINADKQTGEYLLSGMGELHLEIATNELKSTFGIEVQHLRQELFTWQFRKG
jgi:elongation factor 2